ncbi:polyamine aminopropyltransferase [Alysiella crassa]|uniref:Spermidine synthase n=1 Tax=Alysiella crassa TaxID=153491 RepID=A0A376BNK0_9NEIS|nr:Spermidine synthase [Alysiella crassa]
MTHPFRRNRFFRNTLPEVNISEVGNIRSLHLGTPTIQSSMNIAHPPELVLSYSRAMMAWLLFVDDLPKHITQIGLGGGSFARWLHEYLPETRQVAIEINPQVIQVARTSFCLDFEGNNFEIIEADGAEYVQILRGNTDVILVDGFDGVQIIDELVGEPFFHDCRIALREKGIFATNWWSGDKRYPLFMQRLRTIFDGQVLEVPAVTHGNVAVLAFNQVPELNIEKLKKRAEKLSNAYGLDFFRMLADAKGKNRHDGKRFVFEKMEK